MIAWRLGSGGPYEDVVGYSRVVRAGELVWVSGTTGSVDGVVVEGGAAAQMRQALTNVVDALDGAGSSVHDVVRTRIYLTDITAWKEVGRVHGEFFGRARPTTTMVQVSALIDPAMLVEVEADAFVGFGS
ncbi:RidA family protein [Klenkia terrae]|uniref:RidA family protein n=1 Tax=Klenkia terrae TaxID=1052259 RepID=A0ABU8E231_9ACTN|nr:RidA family protein [Klenkia terrae]